MNFLDLPTEIRLKIYSELLVKSEPIVFHPSALFKIHGLHPTLLRVNKKVHGEASPVLYSNNRFRFPHHVIVTENHHLPLFLHKIGSQASLIRHMCIVFPWFDKEWYDIIGLCNARTDQLESIGKTCTSITTLELTPPINPTYKLHNDLIKRGFVDLLDTRFKTIPSLQEVFVNFQEYSEDDVNKDVLKAMRDYGWTVKFARRW